MYHAAMSCIKACCFSSVPTSSQHNQIQSTQPNPASSHIQHPANTNHIQHQPSTSKRSINPPRQTPTTRHHALQGTPFNNSTFVFVVPLAKTRPSANRHVPHRSPGPRHGMRFIPPLPLRKQRRFLRRYGHDQRMRRRWIWAQDLHR